MQAERDHNFRDEGGRPVRFRERQAGKFAATVKFRAVEELSEPGPVYGVRIIKND